MPANQSQPFPFLLQIQGQRDLYPDELDELTRQLRSELLETDVESVDSVAGQAPPGAKSAEAVTLGALAVTVLPAFMPKVIEFLQSWVTRHDGQTVKLKSQAGDRSIEVEFSPQSMSQEQLKNLLNTLNSALPAASSE